MSTVPGMFDFSNMPGLDVLEDAVVTFLAIYLAIMLFASIYSIVVYVLHSLGLYTIAKRRLIHNPWLAWIPIANLWILGSISDQYQYMAKGKRTKRRKTLLGLMIAIYVLAILVGVAIGVMTGMAVIGAGTEVLVPALILILVYIALMVIAIILTVFQYIAYYDLFTSCNPDNAVVFLVLGIFFNFLLPYFVFACRKKDLGVPVPQQPVQPEVPQYMPAPVNEEYEIIPADPGPEDIAQETDPVAEEQDFEPEE